MKATFAFFIFLTLLCCASSASQYQVGSLILYRQTDSGPTGTSKIAPFLKGTITTSSIERPNSDVTADIVMSDRTSSLSLVGSTFTLKNKINKAFLKGEPIQIPNGNEYWDSMQYFRRASKGNDQIVVYDSSHRLSVIIDLIELKKTEQDAAANP